MKKVTKNWIYSLAIMGVLLMILTGYKKKDDNNTVSIPTPTNGAVKDVDGNSYDTIRIGTQV